MRTNEAASVKVRCTSQQVRLDTGKPCGWDGYRRPYYVQRGSLWVTVWPTHKNCPHCGSQVEEVPL